MVFAKMMCHGNSDVFLKLIKIKAENFYSKFSLTTYDKFTSQSTLKYEKLVILSIPLIFFGNIV